MAYMVAVMFGMTVVASTMWKASENSPQTASAKYGILNIGNDGYPSAFE